MSQNYICFDSRVRNFFFFAIHFIHHLTIDKNLLQVKGLVSVVIPLREVKLVEKADSSTYKGILITTISNSFLFAQIPDRDFLVDKLSELLSKSNVPVDTSSLHSSSSGASSFSHLDELKGYSRDFVSPLTAT